MQSSLDLGIIRSQFPGLTREVNGRPAIFLDGPGGSQVPRRVIEAVANCLAHCNANEGGQFATSREVGVIVENAREAMADLLNAGDPSEIVFGQNMTTLTFALSRSIGASRHRGLAGARLECRSRQIGLRLFVSDGG
jgi:selenocysteine lyase/cysteine desulfurase